MPTSNTDFMTIRCPEALKKRLRARAKKDHRTLAEEARYLLDIGMDESVQARDLAECLSSARERS
jgi:plasmid stability protein